MAKRNAAASLNKRIALLEARLNLYGIDKHNLEFLHSPDSEVLPVNASQAARRMMTLLGVSLTAYNFDESDKVMEWLKKEELWKEASTAEKEFFRSPDPTEEYKAGLSWRFEAAYEFAWILDAVSLPAEPTSECNELHANDFFNNVPSAGSPSQDYCLDAHFRNIEEITDEYIFYENVIAYLNDMIVNRKENTSGIHARACFQRLAALRWVVGYKEKTDWDEMMVDEEEEE
ncbi:MAG: DUF4272 domain-containing protein [Flavitalea sp.]